MYKTVLKMDEIISFEINDQKGKFFILINGKEEAEMTFFFTSQNEITINHTSVFPGNEGKSFGKKMVAKAVEFARERNIKITPICPFAKKVLENTPEFSDVLKIV